MRLMAVLNVRHVRCFSMDWIHGGVDRPVNADEKYFSVGGGHDGHGGHWLLSFIPFVLCERRNSTVTQPTEIRLAISASRNLSPDSTASLTSLRLIDDLVAVGCIEHS